MPRIMPGHGRRRIRNPSWSVPTSKPLRSTISGMMPGIGSVPDPGLAGTAPGIGAMRMPPVSVCHQVSTMGQRPLPITRLIPFPGGGIDRLADGAEQAEARKIVRVGPMVALADQRADRGGRSVENADAILLDDAPPAVELRIIGSAFVHHAGRAGRERPVDDVAVAGDPADIGRAPVGVFFLEIEDPLHGRGDVREIAAGGVQNAFGLAGGARRIKHEQGMLAIERDGGTIFGGVFVELMPPEIAACFHRRVGAGAPVNDRRRGRRDILRAPHRRRA